MTKQTCNICQKKKAIAFISQKWLCPRCWNELLHKNDKKDINTKINKNNYGKRETKKTI